MDGVGHAFFNDNTVIEGLSHPFSGAYRGEYVNGYRKGNGIWRRNNGDTYIGQTDGVANGYGVMVSANYIYTGNWRKGSPYGEGLFIYRNGTHLSGTFDGLRLVKG